MSLFNTIIRFARVVVQLWFNARVHVGKSLCPASAYFEVNGSLSVTLLVWCQLLGLYGNGTVCGLKLVFGYPIARP